MILKAVLSELEVIESNRYATYCLRRGTVSEMENPGKTLSRIMASDGWNVPGHKAYLIRMGDGPAIIASLLTEIDLGQDSDPE